MKAGKITPIANLLKDFQEHTIKVKFYPLGIEKLLSPRLKYRVIGETFEAWTLVALHPALAHKPVTLLEKVPIGVLFQELSQKNFLNGPAMAWTDKLPIVIDDIQNITNKEKLEELAQKSSNYWERIAAENFMNGLFNTVTIKNLLRSHNTPDFLLVQDTPDEKIIFVGEVKFRDNTLSKRYQRPILSTADIYRLFGYSAALNFISQQTDHITFGGVYVIGNQPGVGDARTKDSQVGILAYRNWIARVQVIEDEIFKRAQLLELFPKDATNTEAPFFQAKYISAQDALPPEYSNTRVEIAIVPTDKELEWYALSKVPISNTLVQVVFDDETFLEGYLLKKGSLREVPEYAKIYVEKAVRKVIFKTTIEPNTNS